MNFLERSKNPLLYLCGKMWRHVEGNRKKVILFVGMFTISNIVFSLEPLFIGYFLNEVQQSGVNKANIFYLLSLLSIFLFQELLFWAFHGPARVIENKNAYLAKANYKKHLLQGTMAFPIEWHVDHHSGDTIDKIEKGSNALFSFSENIFQFLQAIIFLGTAIVALIYFSKLASLVVLLLSIPTFIILAAFDARLVPGYKFVNNLENQTAARVFDTLSNITTVIILRIESLVFRTVDTAIWKPYDRFVVNAKLNEWKWFSAAILGRLAVVLVIGIYLYRQVMIGTVMVGTIYILYGYVNQIRETFFRFAYLYNDMIRYRTSVANAEEISKDFKEQISSEKNRLPRDWQEIEISNLSFTYHTDTDADLHLNDVALNIKKGERIAIIGESGGGKSTFLKLVRDLYHPKSLDLSVDGRVIASGFKGISNSISLVPQDPEIFATTVRENITLGVEYSESRIKIFTDIARFSEVIERLPRGLESSMVEKGVNLSGGEKQRLALVRGLLASEDKDVILLDEPTSSVDFDNELMIYKNIFEAFPETTIISSIHRLHLLSSFDKIYLFKEGRIVAAGSFDELKDKSQDFIEIWDRYIKARDNGIE